MAITGDGNFPNQGGFLKGRGRGRGISALIKTNAGYTIWNDWFFEAAIGGSANVTPGTGAITLTGYAPTVETPRNVTPGLGELILTGFAPTVETPRNITLGLGELILTGFAPVVSISDNKNVYPGLGELILTGFAPVVSVTANVNITPGIGQLMLTGFEPTVTVSGGGTPITIIFSSLINSNDLETSSINQGTLVNGTIERDTYYYSLITSL